MLSSISGKSILLVAPRFFGYELEIKNEIEKYAGHVDLIIDRPFDKAWQKALLRIFPKLMLIFSRGVFKKKIDTELSNHYDILFFLNPVTADFQTLSLFEHKYPTAKKILYMWDSFKNREHVADIVPHFDRKLTFDPLCAKQYNMEYRPLFYIDVYESKEYTKKIYDLSFVGTMHSDRLKIINLILKQINKEINFFGYLFLHATWFYWFCFVMKKDFRSKPMNFFKYEPIEKNKVFDIFMSSFAILDIEHPNQDGLTMRTFETIGAKRKLITTNKNIASHDFYNSNNIAIIDRFDPVIPDSFFLTEYQDVSDEIYYKYSINGFLSDIF